MSSVLWRRFSPARGGTAPIRPEPALCGETFVTDAPLRQGVATAIGQPCGRDPYAFASRCSSVRLRSTPQR